MTVQLTALVRSLMESLKLIVAYGTCDSRIVVSRKLSSSGAQWLAASSLRGMTQTISRYQAG
jgi:hypothetical protein